MINSKALHTYVSDYIKDTIDLLRYKNKKYGDSILNPTLIFPVEDTFSCVYVRLNDKFARLSNQATGDDEDVVRDIVGYLLFLLYMLDCSEEERALDADSAFDYMTNTVLGQAESFLISSVLLNIGGHVNVMTYVDVLPRIHGVTESLELLINAGSYINNLLYTIAGGEFFGVHSKEHSIFSKLVVALIIREYTINEYKRIDSNVNTL